MSSEFDRRKVFPARISPPSPTTARHSANFAAKVVGSRNEGLVS